MAGSIDEKQADYIEGMKRMIIENGGIVVD